MAIDLKSIEAAAIEARLNRVTTGAGPARNGQAVEGSPSVSVRRLRLGPIT
jgi:hypothetical protein